MIALGSSRLILAIDPGTSKIGWALVDRLGKVAGQGILPVADWESQLAELVDLRQVGVVVIGDGTNRMNIEVRLTRLLPQAPVTRVSEKSSTVDAWQLKRRERAGRGLFGWLWFTVKQLFSTEPVDDYAARVLAMRYLEAGGKGVKT